MTKNEIVVRWMGWPTHRDKIEISDGHKPYKELIKYPMNYDLLHEAWVKFRDLNLPFQTKEENEIYEIHEVWCNNIGTCILQLTLIEAFDELIQGIEWYESLKK